MVKKKELGTKYVKLTASITEYTPDGESMARETSIEISGGFEPQTWTRVNHHGEQLTPEEVAGINDIIVGFKRLLGSDLEERLKQARKRDESGG